MNCESFSNLLSQIRGWLWNARKFHTFKYLYEVKLSPNDKRKLECVKEGQSGNFTFRELVINSIFPENLF